MKTRLKQFTDINFDQNFYYFTLREELIECRKRTSLSEPFQNYQQTYIYLLRDPINFKIESSYLLFLEKNKIESS